MNDVFSGEYIYKDCPKHATETYKDDEANDRCYYCGAIIYSSAPPKKDLNLKDV